MFRIETYDASIRTETTFFYWSLQSEGQQTKRGFRALNFLFKNELKSNKKGRSSSERLLQNLKDQTGPGKRRNTWKLFMPVIICRLPKGKFTLKIPKSNFGWESERGKRPSTTVRRRLFGNDHDQVNPPDEEPVGIRLKPPVRISIGCPIGRLHFRTHNRLLWNYQQSIQIRYKTKVVSFNLFDFWRFSWKNPTIKLDEKKLTQKIVSFRK